MICGRQEVKKAISINHIKRDVAVIEEKMFLRHSKSVSDKMTI